MEGETSQIQPTDDDTDFAHSKNYSNADAHITSYGSYPTLYSNDKETQLEAVVQDQADGAAAEDANAAESEGFPSRDVEANPDGDHTGSDESLAAQAQDAASDAADAAVETAESVKEAGAEAVHELAVAGNAAAEMLEESIGMEKDQDTEEFEKQSPDAEAERQRVLLEEGEKIAADIE